MHAHTNPPSAFMAEARILLENIWIYVFGNDNFVHTAYGVFLSFINSLSNFFIKKLTAYVLIISVYWYY